MPTEILARQAQELDHLLALLKPLFIQYIHENFQDETPVCEAHPPEELRKKLDLKLEEQGVGVQGIVEVIKQALQYSTRTGNPRFFDKLYCGSEPIGMISELLISILNSNVHIFRVSPVFTLVELQIISEMGRIFGFEDADGITCPGGTFANLLAMLAARNTLHPSTKTVLPSHPIPFPLFPSESLKTKKGGCQQGGSACGDYLRRKPLLH